MCMSYGYIALSRKQICSSIQVSLDLTLEKLRAGVHKCNCVGLPLINVDLIIKSIVT